MRLLGLAVAVAMALAIGSVFGWRWIVAPLLAYGLLRWSLASLRVLVTDGRHGGASGDAPAPVGPDERTLFWCEECGTEVLLLVRGTARPPSHCGQRMHERTEIPN